MNNEMKFGERVYNAATGDYIGTFIGVSEEDATKVCILENGTGKVIHMAFSQISTDATEDAITPEVQEMRAKVYAEKHAHFAAAALNGLLAHHGYSEEKEVDVQRAITYADIMVKELSKR